VAENIESSSEVMLIGGIMEPFLRAQLLQEESMSETAMITAEASTTMDVPSTVFLQ
jgi:hypothetical protein